ncbi:hypothetical protein [Streptosporangium roseum]|uniref:Uncharacterized protein n=1 Tax=Streptosporangium roseum (strain ATCC 12428 / DSM 43021 / JCM 3005 / KCTC 9067 / NCIMB 10171 / NRRL 2505 / NI 9100) TaxID=479432 RepID=D2AUY1_STRRD|nr:hypothetical protein [Streptosporangium roseum]ACZ86843.1 hypothetical protein Sros_3927 [Streptosporangium roseum DSM 43021]
MLQLISEVITITVVLGLIWLAMLVASVVVLLALAALALTTPREQDGSRTPRR